MPLHRLLIPTPRAPIPRLQVDQSRSEEGGYLQADTHTSFQGAPIYCCSRHGTVLGFVILSDLTQCEFTHHDLTKRLEGGCRRLRGGKHCGQRLGIREFW